MGVWKLLLTSPCGGPSAEESQTAHFHERLPAHACTHRNAWIRRTVARCHSQATGMPGGQPEGTGYRNSTTRGAPASPPTLQAKHMHPFVWTQYSSHREDLCEFAEGESQSAADWVRIGSDLRLHVQHPLARLFISAPPPSPQCGEPRAVHDHSGWGCGLPGGKLSFLRLGAGPWRL